MSYVARGRFELADLGLMSPALLPTKLPRQKKFSRTDCFQQKILKISIKNPAD